jgi:hypothetical protein
MKTGLIIFNGIQFHDYHAGRAIDWAAKNNGGLLGLFIHSAKEPPEGYLFPSDIDPAENVYNKTDAKKSNLNVIHTQVKLFADMAKGKNVSLDTRELEDPSLEEVLSFTNKTEILFLDDEYDQSFILAVSSFRLKDLVKESASPVETVRDNR